MKYEFKIQEVGRDDALNMVRTYHYSNTLPRINKHFLGCFLNSEIVGIVTLGFGTRPRHTIQKLFPTLGTSDYYEIGRMCMADKMPRNSESQMLSGVVRWIRANEPTIKVLFTWADGIMGKPGYVYQACSFLYAGYIETDMYLWDGVKLHPRGIKKLLLDNPKSDPRLSVRPTLSQMRDLGIDHYRGYQFRYVKFTCGKRERKRLMKECILPLGGGYPKDKDLKWRKIDAGSGRWIECQRPIVLTDSHNTSPDSSQMTLF